MRSIPIFFLGLIFWTCQSATHPMASDVPEGAAPVVTDSAAWVIQQAIKRHGGETFDDLFATFVFRDRAYFVERRNGSFTYQRVFRNEDGQTVQDQLTNQGLTRLINGEPVNLSAKDSSAYANSVNSVIYFALLPAFLQDDAVQLTYHGTTPLLGHSHYKIGVTFQQEAGGKDFEDEYMYWFDTQEFTMDFLAYNFHVNGGGARFRKAFNPQETGGIRWQDYVNYKPKNDRRDVMQFDSLYNAGLMDSLSTIALENISVKTR